MPNRYCTATEVKSVDSDLAGFSDTTIEAVIDWVCEEIDRACGKIFNERTITEELHDGNDLMYLYLNKRPITSVTKVEYYDREDEAWEEYTDDIYPYEDGRIELDEYPTTTIWGSNTFIKGQRNIRITYKYGMTTTPGPITEAAKIWVSRILLKEDVPDEAEVMNVAGVSIRKPVDPDTPSGYPLVDRILKHWRREVDLIAI